MDAQMELENHLVAQCVASSNGQERIRVFTEKAAAKFA